MTSKKVKNMKQASCYILILLYLILFWVSNIYALIPDVDLETQTVNGVSLSIYSVEADGKIGHPDCYNYYGKCIILGSDTPLMVLNQFDYTILNGKKPGFIIHLGIESQQLLHKVSTELIGKKMAIALNRNILHIGKVKSVINSDRLQVTFCNKRNFYTISSVFSGGDIKTIRKLDCHCD